MNRRTTIRTVEEQTDLIHGVLGYWPRQFNRPNYHLKLPLAGNNNLHERGSIFGGLAGTSTPTSVNGWLDLARQKFLSETLNPYPHKLTTDNVVMVKISKSDPLANHCYPKIGQLVYSMRNAGLSDDEIFAVVSIHPAVPDYARSWRRVTVVYKQRRVEFWRLDESSAFADGHAEASAVVKPKQSTCKPLPVSAKPLREPRICKATGKKMYSQSGARMALVSALKSSSQIIPKRMYKCVACKKYHLTKHLYPTLAMIKSLKQ